MMLSKLTSPPIILSDTVFLNVKDLRPFTKNVNIVVLVFEKLETNWTKENHSVNVLRVADSTGSILLTLYDAAGQDAKPGDILRILCGFVTLFKKTMRLACKVGSVHRVGRIKMVAHLQPDLSKVIWESGDNDEQLTPVLPEESDPKLRELVDKVLH